MKPNKAPIASTKHERDTRNGENNAEEMFDNVSVATSAESFIVVVRGRRRGGAGRA